MAELNTVARPYTKAAFEYALEQGSLDQWSEVLATASAVAQDETMKQIIGNPGLTSTQKADALISVLEENIKVAVQIDVGRCTIRMRNTWGVAATVSDHDIRPIFDGFDLRQFDWAEQDVTHVCSRKQIVVEAITIEIPKRHRFR